jgi:hypothetical protein
MSFALSRTTFSLRVFLAAAVSLLAGCAATPSGPLQLTETQTITAVVESIDLPSRVVVLRAPDGRAAVFQAGPQVRNLPQVRKGDKVVIRFQEALLAEVVKRGTGTTGVGAVAARAEPGQRPGALVGTETSVVVKIYEVDTIGNVVEFTGPKGFNRRIKVSDPKAREFLRTLKKGDEVEVRYREAMAVSVEPAK